MKTAIDNVIVTTAPRPKSTLDDTILSLLEAGWPSPMISAELGVDHPRVSRFNSRLKGSWHHFKDVCDWWLKNGSSTLLAVIQDDVQLSSGLRWWLAGQELPWEKIGVLSLWCCGAFHRGGIGWQAMNDLPRECHGALGLVMSRPFVEQLLAANPAPHKPNKIEIHLGRFCAEKDWQWWIPTTSLIQHIGEGNSSIGNYDRSDLYRLASEVASLPVSSPDSIESTS